MREIRQRPGIEEFAFVSVAGELKLKKGATAAPFFDGRGQLTVSCRPSSSRPWLSSPLSVIPPFIWVYLRERSRHRFSGCRLARSPDIGALRFGAPSPWFVRPSFGPEPGRVRSLKPH